MFRISLVVLWLAAVLAVVEVEGQATVPPPPGDSVALLALLGELEALSRAGGWGEVGPGPTLREGDRGHRVGALRQRLHLSGDLPGQPVLAAQREWEPHHFDTGLDRAVRRFQARHGLEVDGAVGPATLGALNVPAGQRVRQIQTNLERRRAFTMREGQIRVLVNVPGFRTYILEEGRDPEIRRVIVGRETRPTPILSGEIEHVVLAPYWNVPSGIFRNDKLPEVRRDISYLQRNQMVVLERATGRQVDPDAIGWHAISAEAFSSRYWLRQEPGPRNALGLVKFIFPNRFQAFLHDTPDRHLFERTRRAFSSGCIRLEGALDLAHRLVDPLPGWGPERVQAVAEGGRERWVPLPEPVPIQTVYWTAWVEPDGTLHLFEDLYRLDMGGGKPGFTQGEDLSECA